MERAAPTDDVIRVAKQAVRLAAFQQLPQALLAVFDRLVAQVAPIDVQQVEHEIGQRRIRTAILQSLKAGDPAGEHRRDLAVQQRAPRRQPPACRRQRGELCRPVLAAPAPELDGAALLAQPDSVTVELLLMDPPVPFGRGADQRGQLRLEIGNPGH